MDHVLLGKDHRYKIGLNGKNQLALTCAAGEQVLSQTLLTAHPCRLFSADTDKDEVLHAACVTADTLVYLRCADGKTSTTHLMRLPDGFSVTDVDLQACGEIRLYYCVKSREGSALICYTLTGDVWKGENLYTCQEDLRLLCAHKERGDCLLEGVCSEGYRVFWARRPDECVTIVYQPVSHAQACGAHAVFCSGGQVYDNEQVIAPGEAVYVLDRERLLVRQGEVLREITRAGRLLGQSALPRGARETALCEAEHEKRLLLSPPFPFLRLERERGGDGLAQEVYMQQRALFSLQAEVRELKQRVRRLEEERKR